MPIGWGQRFLAALLDWFLAILVAMGLLSAAERVVLVLKFKNSLRSRPAPEEERYSTPERSIPIVSSAPSKPEYPPMNRRRVKLVQHGRYGLVDSDDEDVAPESAHGIRPSLENKVFPPAEVEILQDTSLVSFHEMSFEHHGMDHFEVDGALEEDLLGITSPAEFEEDILSSCPWSSQKLTPTRSTPATTITPSYLANVHSFVDTLSSLKEKVRISLFQIVFSFSAGTSV